EFNNGAFCSLPVELTDFDAQADGTVVMLRWKTASEENNAGFELQHRRGNGYGFETMEFVAGNGSTNLSNSYAVSLENLGYGKHTFRLRQIDLDGTFSYSREIEVDVELTERFALTDAYPNPFNPTTTLRFSLREAGEINLAVYDIVGRHVKTLASGQFSAGSHDVTFSADNLPSGTYVYRLQTASGPVAGTLVLLK
ncbi:MAG: T9SS type A sorting domain-containing protein, partial [Rhodothermales bacterium]|nr:T9SS type A sorting domain-containing protein [Rhodothermales bacterium]